MQGAVSEQKAAMGGNGGGEGYGRPVVSAVSDSRGPVSCGECWRVRGACVAATRERLGGIKVKVELSLYPFERVFQVQWRLT